jgi:predicted nucleic acid-binding protein
MIVGLDSNIVIYYVERDPVWEPKVGSRFKSIAEAGDTIAASDAARLECLVGPLQSGASAILTDYQRFFDSPGVQMLPVTPAVWERAARIRAVYKFQALD